jgi:ADP-ribose pyrophosphatase
MQTNRPTQTILQSGKFLTLIKEDRWEYVDRVNGSGAALILAVTAEQRIILVEQHRIPVHARTIELPAGIIGDQQDSASESATEAARRELLEETGYVADSFVPLMTGPSCSGLTSEKVTLFHATGLRRAGEGGGVANEEIIIHEIPMVEVVRWLETKARTGILIDPKIYAGLFFLTESK